MSFRGNGIVLTPEVLAASKADPSAIVNLTSETQLSAFRVGMSISGPPELFGLPPDPPGMPTSTPCVVTAVDYETGTITLSTAEALTRGETLAAKLSRASS